MKQTERITKENLRPCPRCGSMDLEIGTWKGLYGVICMNPECPRVSDVYYSTKAAAVRAWNKRKEPAAVQTDPEDEFDIFPAAGEGETEQWQG